MTPVRGPRPLFAHLRIVFFTFSFEEDLSEEGKKKEEAGGTRSSGVDRVRESTIRPTQEASSRRRRSE